MKFSNIATAIAAAAPLAAAAGYQAAWTITGASCDGQIKLGEYTATPGECMEANCKPIEGVANVSTKSTCVDSHITGANEVLKANPYVLVEVFNQTSNCTGDFNIAIAVTADGTCIPGTNGQASYNVTWSAETGTVWLQYATGDCTGEETRVPFPPASADGKVCTAGFLKALAVAPEGYTGGGSAAGSMPMGGSMDNSIDGDMTMTPGATTTMPVTSDPSGGSAVPSPSPSSGASTSLVGATVAAFAVTTAALA